MSSLPHPRNVLRDPPNLRLLSTMYPELCKYFRFSRREPLRRTDQFMWEDADATRCATDVLLRHLFQLRITLPATHLLPHLTLRLNYVHFLEDLCGGPDSWLRSGFTFHGLDIGVGASCIYPLLLRRLHPQISLLATDVNADSLQLAARNWNANFGAQETTTAAMTTATTAPLFELRLVCEGQLLLAALRDGETVQFCMCNPPFFESTQAKAARGKRSFGAVDSEVATTGGELAFVLQMIDESLILGRRVGTYTSMLGLHSTLAPVLTRLRQLGDAVEAHGSDVFAQGRMTRPVVWWRVA